jgi:uncharacterized protein
VSFVPQPTPETVPYWEGTRAGELRIQHCKACGRHYFYPRPFCRYCSALDVEWTRSSGRARLISYVINHRPLPGFEGVSPVIALVELDEGPRLMTNIINVDPVPEALPLDMRLQVSFAERGDVMLPVFEPQESA